MKWNLFAMFLCNAVGLVVSLGLTTYLFPVELPDWRSLAICLPTLFGNYATFLALGGLK